MWVSEILGPVIFIFSVKNYPTENFEGWEDEQDEEEEEEEEEYKEEE